MSMSPEAMTAVGGGYKAGTDYAAGQENKAIYRFNANQDKIQAHQAIIAGAFQGNQVIAKEAVMRGAQRASFAGQGVVAGGGTAGIVEGQGENVSGMERMLIDINAKRRAYGYQMAAANNEFRGRLAAFQGTEKAIGDIIGASGSAEYEYERENPKGSNGGGYQDDASGAQFDRSVARNQGSIYGADYGSDTAAGRGDSRGNGMELT